LQSEAFALAWFKNGPDWVNTTNTRASLFLFVLRLLCDVCGSATHTNNLLCHSPERIFFCFFFFRNQRVEIVEAQKKGGNSKEQYVELQSRRRTRTVDGVWQA